MSKRLSSVLRSRVSEALMARGFQVPVVSEDDTGARSGGEVGTVIAIRILVTGNSQTRQLYAVVKTASSQLSTRKHIAITLMVNTEIHFYESIAPVYERLQTHLPLKDGTLEFPTLYATSEEYLREFIVLEDLESRGYRLAAVLDYDHARLAIRALAKFHALSLILQLKEPKEFYEITRKLTYDIFASSYDYDASGVRHYGEQAYDKFIKVLNNENSRMQLSAKRATFVDHLKMLLGSGNIKVISHGDYWINNIMFQYQVILYFTFKFCCDAYI